MTTFFEIPRASARGRSSSNAGDDIVVPVSSLIMQDQYSMVFSEARGNGHFTITWAAVLSNAPHSLIDRRARPYKCMDNWNLPTLAHGLQH